MPRTAQILHFIIKQSDLFRRNPLQRNNPNLIDIEIAIKGIVDHISVKGSCQVARHVNCDPLHQFSHIK